MPRDLRMQDVDTLVDASLELWNTGNAAVAPRVYSPHSQYHQPGQPTVSGPDGIAGFVTALRGAFPDLRFEPNETFVSGNRFALCWTCTGTHKGAFLGVPPSGKYVKVQGVSVGTIVNGLFEETTVCYDRLSFLEQVGAVPAPMEMATP
jgi:steroid delta-isomerase-like uncharacterized protein